MTGTGRVPPIAVIESRPRPNFVPESASYPAATVRCLVSAAENAKGFSSAADLAMALERAAE